MPYLAILAATGIVALASFGWKIKKYRFLFVPIGIGVLVLFTSFSIMGIQDYYDNYQKEDWRSASQFLTTRCSESLRLFYAPYVENSVLYYNHELYSQIENILDENELTASLKNDYNQVCLVLSHNHYDLGEAETKSIQSAIQKEFPIKSIDRFYAVEIELYKR